VRSSERSAARRGHWATGVRRATRAPVRRTAVTCNDAIQVTIYSCRNGGRRSRCFIHRYDISSAFPHTAIELLSP
jgi:hypothetical protein